MARELIKELKGLCLAAFFFRNVCSRNDRPLMDGHFFNRQKQRISLIIGNSLMSIEKSLSEYWKFLVNRDNKLRIGVIHTVDVL